MIRGQKEKEEKHKTFVIKYFFVINFSFSSIFCFVFFFRKRLHCQRVPLNVSNDDISWFQTILSPTCYTSIYIRLHLIIIIIKKGRRELGEVCLEEIFGRMWRRRWWWSRGSCIEFQLKRKKMVI